MGLTRRLGLALACALVLGVVVAVAVARRDGGDGGGSGEPSGSASAPPLTGPLEVSPARLGQGDPFTATLTDGRVVGGSFSLAVWDGVGWTYQYQLFGAAQAYEEKDQPWRTWRERTDSVPGQRLGGVDPIHLVVPSHVIAGDYRLCLEQTTPPVCSGLTVTD